MLDTKEARETAARITADPVYFVREVLGDDPWGKQIEFLESIRDNKRTTMRSCHGTGKTHIAARAALWYLATHPDSVVVTTAPTWFQVEELMWREIRGAYAGSKFDLGGKITSTKLEIDTNWVAYGLSTNDPNRFQGSHAVSGNLLLLVDEAPGVDQDIFDSAEGFLVSDGSRVGLAGNPTMLSGEFYQSFRSKLYHKISISAFDTPNFTTFGITIEDIRNNTWKQKINKPLPRPYLITPAWVAEKYIKWGENSPLWFARVMGEFPSKSDNTLIPLAWIERAQARWTDTVEGTNVVLGADIGLGNPDPAVIVKRTGTAKMTRIERLRELYADDTMEITGVITADVKTENASAINIDKIGLGAGVTDRMREHAKNKTITAVVRGINSAMPAIDDGKFFNLRSEMAWELRERFETDTIAIDPRDEEAAEELAIVRTYGTTGLDSKGRIRMEPKDDTKERLGRSPNYFDAACLACARTLAAVDIRHSDGRGDSEELDDYTITPQGIRNERVARFLAGRRPVIEKRKAVAV
jgi:phage terminase large subunit